MADELQKAPGDSPAPPDLDEARQSAEQAAGPSSIRETIRLASKDLDAPLEQDVSAALEETSQRADIDLTDEQRKRIDLLSEYEELTAIPRGERNAAIEAFEEDWRKRWLELQPEIDNARTARVQALEQEGIPVERHGDILAKETAGIYEKFESEKDDAARKLYETLPQPKKWVDFLQEQKLEHPDDPTLDSLIEEAKKAPDPSVQGFDRSPPKRVVLYDLAHTIEKDGTIAYKRGLSTAIRDTGTRLDVKKLDDRDIEAALKIAAQKFDMQKGLMLTGDAAFKARAAEIAGRLGYPLQNAEPEVLMAWKRGRDQNAELKRSVVPSVERGITGDLAPSRQMGDLSSPVLLRADAYTLSNIEKLGLVQQGNEISMPSKRVLAANAAIRELPVAALGAIARADISKPDGGLTSDQKALLAKEGLLDSQGQLSDLAKDVIVVRDDRVMRTRDGMTAEAKEVFGVSYKTSGDHIRERAGQIPEQAQEAGKAQERSQESGKVQEQVKEREIEAPEIPSSASELFAQMQKEEVALAKSKAPTRQYEPEPELER